MAKAKAAVTTGPADTETKVVETESPKNTKPPAEKTPKAKKSSKTKKVRLFSKGDTPLTEDMKLPKQLRIIVETLNKQKGTVSLEELAEAVDKAGIETTQPVSRIITFYGKRMEEEGLAKIEVKEVEVK